MSFHSGLCGRLLNMLGAQPTLPPAAVAAVARARPDLHHKMARRGLLDETGRRTVIRRKKPALLLAAAARHHTDAAELDELARSGSALLHRAVAASGHADGGTVAHLLELALNYHGGGRNTLLVELITNNTLTDSQIARIVEHHSSPDVRTDAVLYAANRFDSDWLTTRAIERNPALIPMFATCKPAIGALARHPDIWQRWGETADELAGRYKKRSQDGRRLINHPFRDSPPPNELEPAVFDTKPAHAAWAIMLWRQDPTILWELYRDEFFSGDRDTRLAIQRHGVFDLVIDGAAVEMAAGRLPTIEFGRLLRKQFATHHFTFAVSLHRYLEECWGLPYTKDFTDTQLTRIIDACGDDGSCWDAAFQIAAGWNLSVDELVDTIEAFGHLHTAA